MKRERVDTMHMKRQRKRDYQKKTQLLAAERNMTQNTDVWNKNESKMDEHSSSHTRGAQIPGVWLPSLHPVFTILYCKMQYKCIYTCTAFYLTLQHYIDEQMMVINDCNM